MNADQVIFINTLIHSRLEDQINEARRPMDFRQEGSNTKEDMINIADKASRKQKEIMKANEDNNQKYKALQKYSYVLNEVERLIGIIPDNTDDLSLENLVEKLDGLVKSRNTIVDQINFEFYQTMYSDSMNELLEIEKCYQDGSLTSNDALKKVREIGEKLSANSLSVPSILKPTQESVEYLVSQYTQAYMTESMVNQSTADINISTPSVRLETEIAFQELNIKTRDLTADLITLKSDLNSFVPMVNLDDLAKKIKNTNEYIQEDEWSADKLSEYVVDIQGVTSNLYNQQNKKNWEHESYANKITEMTELATTVATDCKVDIVKETVTHTDERADEVEEITETIEELTENQMPEDIAESFANVLNDQLAADEENIAELVNDPELIEIVSKCRIEDNLDAQKLTLDLKARIEELVMERSPKLVIETPDESNK